MIVNLTPHPISVYPIDTPDRIDPGTAVPLHTVPVSVCYQPARLGQHVVANTEFDVDDIPVERVAFGPDPRCARTLPEPIKGTWYLVSLVVGLAATDRHDLLVVHDYVRDTDGRIIGCRKLATPQR